MIVFGHRRARVPRTSHPRSAVVKNLEDIAHIVMQGQENTARANLSFIEKALFGKKLREMGQSKETIKAALTVDDTLPVPHAFRGRNRSSHGNRRDWSGQKCRT